MFEVSDSDNNTRGQLFLLTSYMKSGNTWVRLFINQILRKRDNKNDLDINNFNVGNMSSSRIWIENILGIGLGELSHDEIDNLRPLAYSIATKKLTSSLYMKVHDAYSHTKKGQPLFPTHSVKGVLYIVRNPLDVATSLAHHSAKDLSDTITNLNDHNHSLCGSLTSLDSQLRQKVFSWSEHVESWLTQTQIPVYCVRYEDMKHDSFNIFRSIAHFLDLPYDKKSIEYAIETCSFKNLQQQEKDNGFKEKPSKAEFFFRKGIVGDWQNHLNEEQKDRIIEAHGKLMLQLGYLDSSGQPCVRHSSYLDTLNNRIISKNKIKG
ncbi:sulfotransferase domain-containing protein [Marinomonas mediterranea]|uniref:sulfotransferase domain-containing protein n=1 Tax=Marinomonas mediterranea TaxID=119864 RepID=UPI0023497E3C|nr:sulfotransferase domain-containing protein [Marinomonas mediterranea]WCN08578.1 hypothetical protein GV055_06365 [Marinomonas mediterranea]